MSSGISITETMSSSPSSSSSSSSIVDVLIVGGSHAGLSAALTLYRALHTSIIFDTDKPRNAYATPVRLVSTWEGRAPDDMKEAARRELLAAGLTTFVDADVMQIERKAGGSLFEATDGEGRKWLGRKVILSYGAQDVFPAIPGYEDVYARGVYPCMFQFGYELRGSESAGVLAVDGLASPVPATMLTGDGQKFADAMTIYTNGNRALAEDISTRVAEKKTVSVDDRRIARLGRVESGRGVLIDFEDGTQRTEAFLVHRPLTKVDGRIPGQLGVEMSKMGEIMTTPPFNRTSVGGVYAAGDCGTPMKTVSNAMTMGSYAACGISRELTDV
ncbi:FAD/NAD(P)-binding domain-containing protein [Xylaria sp. CBS 124048]|nr:FAD/NAD(P)-binding domain-containing protein [Xylaria sp. CBS 124048]